MKYYSYSVKELLTTVYGNDALLTMRNSHYEDFEMDDSESSRMAHCWCVADYNVLDLFPDGRILIDTEIRDDYIAYTFYNGTKKQVYLVFISVEENYPFKMDLEYAKELTKEWTDAGFEPLFIRECIDLEAAKKYYPTVRKPDGSRENVYWVQKINGRESLVEHTLPQWDYFERALVDVLNHDNVFEYECIFSTDVKVFCQETLLAEGINGVRELAARYGMSSVVYTKNDYEDTYLQRIILGDYSIVFYVGARNLIEKIELTKVSGDFIREQTNTTKTLLDSIPSIISIRPLDPVQIHALAIQITYDDKSVRNYYLHPFEEMIVPDSIEVDGCLFTKETLGSASVDDNGDIKFQNGFHVPKHLAYYHSYRQVVIEYPEHTYGEIKPVYKLPPHNGTLYFCFHGNDREVFGPVFPILDDNGKRITDVTVYNNYESNKTLEADMVRVEPTGKVGFLKKDGSWLVPPVFDSAKCESVGLALGMIKRENKEEQYLICRNGAKKTSLRVNVEFSCEYLTPYNISDEKEVFFSMPGNLYDDFFDEDVGTGVWGFLDPAGETVITPQYAYAVGFFGSWSSDAESFAMVGRRNKDGVILSGVINAKGEEVIPCKYYELHHIPEDVFAFRQHDDELYGVIDLQGHILSDQQFQFVYDYDADHQMLSVGESEYCVGVYSLKHKRMLTGVEYEEIEYEDTYFLCKRWGGPDDWFDYDGNLIPCGNPIKDSEKEGMLELWQNDIVQLIRFDGTPVSEPTTETWRYDQKENVKNGYYVYKRRKWLRGLNSVDGKELIPPIYTDVEIKRNYVIATLSRASWHLQDALYRTDGTIVIKGAYRNMYFDEDKFTVDTPTGKEYCIVQDPDYLEDLSLYKAANEVFYKAVQEREIPPEYWLDEFKKKMRSCITSEEKNKYRIQAAADIEKRFPLKASSRQ